MLKRNDLAKQFELVVQQEIKNHNDQMLATNLSLNEMREAIESNKVEQDKVNATFGSNISNINQSLFALSESFLKISQNIASHINDQQLLNERNSAKYQEMVEAIERLFKLDDKLAESLGIYGNWINKNNNDVNALSKAVTSSFEELDRKHTAKLEKMKVEILSLPSEAQAVKKELEEKISVDRVDFTGILKELRAYKKDTFIQEKKIEQIYTLIERLDKRIPK